MPPAMSHRDSQVGATARQLRLILEAIDRGDLDATATVRSRLEGAAVALETLAAGDPAN